MTDIINIQKINEVYNAISSEPSLMMEMSDYFTFDVPGAKFMPSYKNKVWDGKIRLLNIMSGYLYSGLLPYVEKFCKDRDYQLNYLTEFYDEEFSIKEAKDFYRQLNLKIEPREYQTDAFVHAVRKRRALLLSPTASGKSLIIYLLAKYYNQKTLIIVPTTSLVHQLAGDFKDYGYEEEVHKIYSGQDRVTDKKIVISTWQSIYKFQKKWFSEFDVVIGDEAHNFKAKSLISIMTKLEDCKYRFGFTGTLDGTETNKLVLEGLFGPVLKVTTTKKLIDDKHLSDFRIKIIVLKYPDKIKSKFANNKDYQREMDYIVTLEKRNKFIKNLALSLEGNTLLLFQYVEKHGKILYDIIKDEADCPVYFIHGGVSGEERNKMKDEIESMKKSISVASYGTFSTGINIPSIENLIFASPTKSKIRNLQSIGRALRKSDSKEISTLFDISDDISSIESDYRNFTIRHLMERVKIYNAEQFNYKLYKVGLEVD